MKSKTNRKLKRRVVFVTQETFNKYQIIPIKWIMKHYELSESKASDFYIESGLAKAFKEHHRMLKCDLKKDNVIEIKEMGQKIN